MKADADADANVAVGSSVAGTGKDNAYGKKDKPLWGATELAAFTTAPPRQSQPKIERERELTERERKRESATQQQQRERANAYLLEGCLMWERVDLSTKKRVKRSLKYIYKYKK